MYIPIGRGRSDHRHARGQRAYIIMGLRTVGCLITLALGIALALPAAVGQPRGEVPRIGYLTDSAAPQSEVQAFQGALHEIGYVEGQNIAFALRFAEPEQYTALAAELVGLQVDVLVVRRGVMALAAKQATTTIPIVMVISGDAVGQGIVASLARPGGNVTGLTSVSPDRTQKQLALLKEAVPELARVAVLRCPIVAGQPNHVDQLQWRELQEAANLLGLHLQSLEVRALDDLEALFEAAVRERADALMTLDCVYTNPELAQRQIGSLTVTHRLPAMLLWFGVEAGGLMAYGAGWGADGSWRRVAVYVDKILKGAKPADLPVEQPMQYYLAINLKTAKALGLTIPPTLLFQADKVIQ